MNDHAVVIRLDAKICCKGLITTYYLFTYIPLAYELWFKQIIHELDSIRDIFTLEELVSYNYFTLSRLSIFAIFEEVEQGKDQVFFFSLPSLFVL